MNFSTPLLDTSTITQDQPNLNCVCVNFGKLLGTSEVKFQTGKEKFQVDI